MADDEAGSVTHQAVENGQEEPSEDRVDDAMQDEAEASRTIPVASTNFSQSSQIIMESRFSRAEKAVCCTSVVHNRRVDDAENPCGVRAPDPSDCCTSVVHNRRKTIQITARPIPSGNGRQEPSQRSPSRSWKTPGLIVRGRVFYLRLRVPRALVTTVGRTHVWRSLRTGDQATRVNAAWSPWRAHERLQVYASPTGLRVYQLDERSRTRPPWQGCRKRAHTLADQCAA